MWPTKDAGFNGAHAPYLAPSFRSVLVPQQISVGLPGFVAF
jgi:hypothetical protein